MDVFTTIAVLFPICVILVIVLHEAWYWNRLP